MYWRPIPELYPPYLRRRIARGRGVRDGPSYVPWLKVRDVPSRGTSSVVSGIVVNRTHHLLSELEATYFYLVERRPETIDILEQWPVLDIDETLKIARRHGVRHPFKGPYPEPFTIDLLIAERSPTGTLYRAASIKSPGDAVDPDIRRRLAVEHAWCEAHGIPWTLVDTSRFDKVLLANLRSLRGWHRHRFATAPGMATMFAHTFLHRYETNVLLSELITRTAKSLRLDMVTAQDLFRYCGWTDRIAVSLRHEIALDRPLILRRAPTPCLASIP